MEATYASETSVYFHETKQLCIPVLFIATAVKMSNRKQSLDVAVESLPKRLFYHTPEMDDIQHNIEYMIMQYSK
jgi:hypothetical protein